MKKHGIVSFWNCVFFQFFFQHHIFNTFPTNLHPISFQLNLLQFEFNLIQFACNVIEYYHSKWNLILTLKSNFFSLIGHHWQCVGTKGPNLIIAKLEKPLWFVIDEILLSFVPFLKSCLTTFLLFFLAHLFSLFPSLLVSPNHFLPLFFPLPSSPFPPFASYYFPHPRYRPPKRQ